MVYDCVYYEAFAILSLQKASCKKSSLKQIIIYRFVFSVRPYKGCVTARVTGGAHFAHDITPKNEESAQREIFFGIR